MSGERARLDVAIKQGSLPAIHPTAVASGLLGAMEARCFHAYLGGHTFAPGEDEAFLHTLVDGLLHPIQEAR